ncbi:elongation factor G [candidate division WOR-3 bacterium]|nr:elongation factor G [candidate division WOR-3 bacterium]
MKEFGVNDIRNVMLCGHGGVGKTTLAEAMLFDSGERSRLGRVDEGNSTMDYDQLEIDRKITVSLAIGQFPWKNSFINLLDTPGYADFRGEVISATAVSDGAVIVVDATSGVEMGTEWVCELIKKHSMPSLVYINVLKKENSDFFKVLEEISKMFKSGTVPLTIPIGEGEKFSGVINLLSKKAYVYRDGKAEEIEIPDTEKGKVEEMSKNLVEGLVETDDDLMERYLADEDIKEEELAAILKKGVIKGEVHPVFCGDAYHNIGVDHLLNGITQLLPSPEERGDVIVTEEGKEKILKINDPFCALVFKTIFEPHLGELNYTRIFSGELVPGTDIINITKGSTERINQIYLLNGKERKEVKKLLPGSICALVKLKSTKTGDTLTSKGQKMKLSGITFPEPSISIAIVPKSKADEEKVSFGLGKLRDEDPCFSSHYDSELKQTLISGFGELHLEVIVDKLKRKFGVEVSFEKPKIPFRETITVKSEVQGKYKKQSGGRGQYGDVRIRFEPLSSGRGFEFVNGVVGGSIPSKYIPSVEKGLNEAIRTGVLAGYPVVDFKATLYDGTFHSVDSSDIAFKVAASMAFKKGMEDSKPILLEPIMNVEVVVPEDMMGDVIGDLNSRRGKIQGMDSSGRLQKIKASVPQAEMYKYSTQLRSITQGRGTFTQSFSHYEEMPKEISDKIVQEHNESKED